MHGTGRNPPEKYYEGDEGFDIKFSKANGRFGKAIYFAENA